MNTKYNNNNHLPLPESNPSLKPINLNPEQIPDSSQYPLVFPPDSSPRPTMATIFYIDYFGEKQEIEVTKDFKEKYDAIIKKEQLIERKETRRHTSLDNLTEKGFVFHSSLPTPETEYEKSVLIEHVRTLIFSLTPSQQKLIRQLFYEDLTMNEIARLENVTPSAIRHRWGRIKKELREKKIT
ncbi:MAG: Sigma-70, region 4 [Firmicutes bacterium ADurb.Bin080]|nr:MAG: Sigma-70, region 4 [Firmicutes bacterium ADurb.Bin080]